MIEICVEKEVANPWADDTPQLRETLRIISPLLKEDLATMRRVSKTWNKYLLELLNKQGFDEKKIAAQFQQLISCCDFFTPNQSFDDECLKDAHQCVCYNVEQLDRCLAYWGTCLMIPALFGVLPLFWEFNRNDLKEILAYSGHQLLQSESVNLTFEQVSRSMRQFIALGLAEGCPSTRETGAIYDCWNDLLNQSRPAELNRYLIEDFSITWGSLDQWNSASWYKLFIPVILFVSVVCLSKIRSPLNEKLLNCNKDNIAIADKIDRMQRAWIEIQKESDLRDPALARYRNLMKQKVRAYQNDLIEQIAPWRHFLLKVILSGGYLVSGGLIIHGLIQSLAKASEGDYEFYRNFFNQDEIVDPTSCSHAYDHFIGLSMNNCTQYIFDQEQLWKLFADKAPLDQEVYVEQMTFMAKIWGGIIGGIFGLSEIHDFIQQSRRLHIVHKTGLVMKRAFQSLKGSVSCGIRWLCRSRYTNYTVND